MQQSRIHQDRAPDRSGTASRWIGTVDGARMTRRRVISPASPSRSRAAHDAPPTSASRARFNTEAFSPIPMVNMHEGVTVHHGQEGCPQDIQEDVEEEGKEVVEEEVIRIVRIAST
jgi:hypothetical protein